MRHPLAMATLFTLALAACENSSTTAFAGSVQAASGGALQELISDQMIGQSLRIFEQLAGDPKGETEIESTYIVENCNVSVEREDGLIKTITIDLHPDCDADLGSALFADSPELKYEQLKTLSLAGALFSDAEITGSCLAGSCGNSGLPAQIFATVPGAHVNNFISLQATLDVDFDTQAAPIAEAWLDELTKNPNVDRYEPDSGLCDRSLDSVARKMFADVPIKSIRFGRFSAPSSYCGG